MDYEAPPSSASHATSRSALETAVLAYEGASAPPRRGRARRIRESEAGWLLVDQIDVRGARYVLARRDDPNRGVERLTARERQVLRFLAEGHTTKVAAYELGIADATV